jgi:hypothetical protein
MVSIEGADILKYLRVPLRCGTDPFEDILHLGGAIHAESRSLLLILIEHFVELGPGCRP